MTIEELQTAVNTIRFSPENTNTSDARMHALAILALAISLNAGLSDIAAAIRSTDKISDSDKL